MVEHSVIQQNAAVDARLTRDPSGVRKGPRWRRPFIRSLERHGNVARACRDAGISPALAYKIRATSSRFAGAWDFSIIVAEERKKERLEAALRDRALYGYPVTVVHGGRVVGRYWRPCVSSMLLALEAYSSRLSRKAVEPFSAPVPPRTPEPPPDPIRELALVDPEVARALATLEAHLGRAKPPADRLTGPPGGTPAE